MMGCLMTSREGRRFLAQSLGTEETAYGMAASAAAVSASQGLRTGSSVQYVLPGQRFSAGDTKMSVKPQGPQWSHQGIMDMVHGPPNSFNRAVDPGWLDNAPEELLTEGLITGHGTTCKNVIFWDRDHQLACEERKMSIGTAEDLQLSEPQRAAVPRLT